MGGTALLVIFARGVGILWSFKPRICPSRLPRGLGFGLHVLLRALGLHAPDHDLGLSHPAGTELDIYVAALFVCLCPASCKKRLPGTLIQTIIVLALISLYMLWPM